MFRSKIDPEPNYGNTTRFEIMTKLFLYCNFSSVPIVDTSFNCVHYCVCVCVCSSYRCTMALLPRQITLLDWERRVDQVGERICLVCVISTISNCIVLPLSTQR